MALPLIADFILAVQMNAPRTELAYDQIRALAVAYEDARLIALIDAGYGATKEVSRLSALRRVQREARSDAGDDEFDRAMDDAARPLVRGLIDMNDYFQRSRHPQRARLARLIATHAPTGPGDIISVRYEEELFRVRALIADLRGPYADLIDELEIERKLRRVEALVAPYAEALAARRRVTAAEVRAAAREMHQATLVIIAQIIARWHTQPEAMEALLLPIVDQQTRIRAILKARRSGQDAVSDDPSRDDDDILDVEGADGEPDPPEPADGLPDLSDDAGVDDPRPIVRPPIASGATAPLNLPASARPQDPAGDRSDDDGDGP